MKFKTMTMISAITGVLAVMGGWAIAAQDKYTVAGRMGWRSLTSEDTKTGRQSGRVTPTGKTL
jgi:hypothetical protein